MPTKTFLNLPQEKQNIILEASIKEFKRVLLKDASINKIIKDASISRGSFYTYFKDINDLYIYTLRKYQDKFYKLAKDSISENNGDLIKTTKQIYEIVIQDCTKELATYKNIFLNINYNISIKNQIECDLDNKYRLIELISKIDKTKLNIKTEEELFYIIDIIVGIVLHGLIEIFISDKNPELVKEKLNKQIKLIEKGICKEWKHFLNT